LRVMRCEGLRLGVLRLLIGCECPGGSMSTPRAMRTEADSWESKGVVLWLTFLLWLLLAHREARRPPLHDLDFRGRPLDPRKQLAGLDPQGGGELDQRVDPRRPRPTLKQPDLGAVKRGAPAKLFLADACPLATAPQVLSEPQRAVLGGHLSPPEAR